jgi:tetratricopeptide (TPR) repeat protein
MTDAKVQNIDSALLELNRAARQALAVGDIPLALEKLKTAVDLEPKSHALWLNYAAALRQAGRLEAGLAAVDEALKLDPRSFNALLARGVLLDRAGRQIEAGQAYKTALLFTPKAGTDPATQTAIARAQAVAADYDQGRAAAIDQALQTARESKATNGGRNIERFVEFTAGRAKMFTPQPSQYFFPGLASQEFYDRALFPWLEQLEAKTAAITAELTTALEQRPDLVAPYVNEPDTVPIDQWRELNRSTAWSALHIIKHGAQQPYAQDLFPKTLEALALLPQPVVPGRTPSAMFSALQPRTRIPAHVGVSNARLVLHLPLIVPPNCGFRVGSETRSWKVGEAWVFDDTIDHEAWNDSDELRVILIADIWNVFMTEDERAAYTAVVTAIDTFNRY